MTYSVYNINIDNSLSFTPGATAGNVLAINSDGSTSWVPQSGGGGSQTLAQTLALGNDVDGNSIIATSGPITLSNPNNNSYISISGTESNQIILSQGLEGTSGRANIILDGGSQTVPTDSSISIVAENLQIKGSYRPPAGIPETASTITMASQSISITSGNAGIFMNDIFDSIHIDGNVSFSTNPTYSVSLGITSSLLATDADGKIIATSSTAGASNQGSFGITIDGGGSAITTGTKGYVSIPYGGTITGWVLMSDQTGSIVIDVWKDNYASFPPTVADTIAGSEKPTLSSAIINQNVSLSTWTTSITAGDIIAFNVDSASTLTRVNLAINITKS